MLPIIIDTNKVKIIAIGNSVATLRRMHIFDDACANVTLFSPNPSSELSQFAGNRLVARMPILADLKDAKFVFIADFNLDETTHLVEMAHSQGALVNAEDKTELCDFHVPAIVRRGDLLLTVSTNAKSPRLARRIRQNLEKQFGDEWAQRLEDIGKKRDEWKKSGDGIEELARKTDELLLAFSEFQ